MMKTMLGAIALMTTPAIAVDYPAEEYEVAIDDLDLSSERGQAAFDARISQAAGIVCKRAYRGDNLGLAHIRRCRSDVVAAAAPQRNRALAAHRSDRPVLAVTLRIAGR